MRGIKMSCVVLGVAVLLLATAAANADTNLLQNGSFEAPGLATDGSLAGTTAPDFWTWNGVNNTGDSKPIEIDNGAAGPTPTPDLNQSVALFAGAELWQNAGISMVSGRTYTFSMQECYTVGRSAVLQLYAADDGLAASKGTAIPTATSSATGAAWASWSPVQVQYTAGAGDAGKYLTVGFSTVGGTSYAWFDNATLTATPEPGTVVLLVTGLLGLLCYAWRKRK